MHEPTEKRKHRHRQNITITIAIDSTVIDADEILYMEDGMVAARGAHDYLMQTSTRYAHLVEGQLLRDHA